MKKQIIPSVKYYFHNFTLNRFNDFVTTMQISHNEYYNSRIAYSQAHNSVLFERVIMIQMHVKWVGIFPSVFCAFRMTHSVRWTIYSESAYFCLKRWLNHEVLWDKRGKIFLRLKTTANHRLSLTSNDEKIPLDEKLMQNVLLPDWACF